MKITTNIFVLIIFYTTLIVSSCAYPKNFTKDFYSQNERTLEGIASTYKQLYNEKPFAILFENKSFQNISFEIITDSLKYIYHFNLSEPAFADTLTRYKFNTKKMQGFIADLQKIQCTWITNVDYYENYTKRYLVLMSVRNKALNNTFKGESYCTLAFFERPQPADEKGRFLDRSDRKRTRQINGFELLRINDRVGYAITKQYR